MMNANNVLGVVFSHMYDEAVGELTAARTMGSMPFAGRYRLIDFVLSGMVNAGVGRVGVITKSNYRSLMDHVGSGMAWDLSRKRGGLTILPPFDRQGTGMHTGRLDALRGIMDYINFSNKEYVLLSDCNVVCNPDYGQLIDSHIKTGADITIACKHGIKPNLPDSMVFTLDGDRITDVAVAPVTAGNVDFSLNIIIMKRVLLETLVNAAVSHSGSTFEHDIIQRSVKSLDIRAYLVDEMVCPIDSLQSYYDISMSLLDGKFRDLFRPDRRVYTKVRDDMPAIYGLEAKIKNTLVADGCSIKGTVENCILFRGVRVEEGAVVKNSIIMQDSFIGSGAKINYAIFDKRVFVKPDRELSGAPTYPIYIGKQITV